MRLHPLRPAVALPVLLATLLVACATPYRPQGLVGGGFSESWRGDDKVVVTFNGSTATRPAVAEDMAMLRAADLTLARGYTHFAVKHAGDNDQAVHLGQPRNFSPNDYIFPYAAFPAESSTNSGGTLYTHGARLYVVLLKDPPAGTTGLYDARAVHADLGPLYDEQVKPPAR